MKIAGHDRILRLKNKRLEITLNNCKNLHILQFNSPIDGSICKTSAAPDPDQLQGKIILCCWFIFVLPGMTYQDCGS